MKFRNFTIIVSLIAIVCFTLIEIENPSKGLQGPTGSKTVLIEKGWLWNTYATVAAYTDGDIGEIHRQVDTWGFYETQLQAIGLKIMFPLAAVVLVGMFLASENKNLAISINSDKHVAMLVDSDHEDVVYDTYHTEEGYISPEEQRAIDDGLEVEEMARIAAAEKLKAKRLRAQLKEDERKNKTPILETG